MAEFIKPVVDKVIAVLQARTAALLGTRPPFVDFGKAFTGVAPNFPSLYVMSVRTAFNADSQHLIHQAHQITVKLAVSASEPDEVVDAALDYMKAVDAALQASWPADWDGLLAGGSVLRLFVAGHDYGPLFDRQGVLARFPELELLIETVL